MRAEVEITGSHLQIHGFMGLLVAPVLKRVILGADPVSPPNGLSP